MRSGPHTFSRRMQEGVGQVAPGGGGDITVRWWGIKGLVILILARGFEFFLLEESLKSHTLPLLPFVKL